MGQCAHCSSSRPVWWRVSNNARKKIQPACVDSRSWWPILLTHTWYTSMLFPDTQEASFRADVITALALFPPLAFLVLFLPLEPSHLNRVLYIYRSYLTFWELAVIVGAVAVVKNMFLWNVHFFLTHNSHINKAILSPLHCAKMCASNLILQVNVCIDNKLLFLLYCAYYNKEKHNLMTLLIKLITKMHQMSWMNFSIKETTDGYLDHQSTVWRRTSDSVVLCSFCSLSWLSTL